MVFCAMEKNSVVLHFGMESQNLSCEGQVNLDFFRLMKENDNREKVMKRYTRQEASLSTLLQQMTVLMLAKHVVRTVLAASDFLEPFLRPSIPLSHNGLLLLTIYSTSSSIKLLYHRNLTMLIDLRVRRKILCPENLLKISQNLT